LEKVLVADLTLILWILAGQSVFEKNEPEPIVSSMKERSGTPSWTCREGRGKVERERGTKTTSNYILFLHINYIITWQQPVVPPGYNCHSFSWWGWSKCVIT